MEDLFKMLPGLMKSFPDSPEVHEAVVLAVWRRAAGEGLREHALPISLDGKRLSILVRDEIWKRHMESMAPQLLFRLNALLEISRVDFLEFRVDDAAFDSTREETTYPKDIEKETAQLPQSLRKKADKIKDPALRKDFLDSAEAYLSMRELRKDS